MPFQKRGTILANSSYTPPIYEEFLLGFSFFNPIDSRIFRDRWACRLGSARERHVGGSNP